MITSKTIHLIGMTRRDKACLVSIHRFFFLAEFETETRHALSLPPPQQFFSSSLAEFKTETRRALSLPMTNAFYGMTLNSITVMVE
jgi:hypothetical protein